LTGVTFFTIALGPKRLELLRELLPMAGKIAMLVNPKSLNPDAKEVQEASRALGQSVHVLDAATERDVERRFDRWRKSAMTRSLSSPIRCSPADENK
jgi:putative ABC transport system substrate-binding protein